MPTPQEEVPVTVVADALPIELLPDEKPPAAEEPAPEPPKDEKADKPEGDDPDGEDDDPLGGTDKTGTGEEKPKRQRPGRNARERLRQEARIEELTSTVRELTQAIARPAAVETQAKAATELKPPKMEDFEDHDEYIRAMTRWEVRQETAKLLKDREEQWSTQQRETQESQRIQSAKARLEKARDKYEDFEAVAFSEDVPISRPMMDVMEDSEFFGDIAYFLGSHPDEAARIARLSPAAAAREIGRIEGQFLNPPAKKPTSAPAPVKTVKAGGEATKDPSRMTYDEYKKWRETGGG